MDDAAFAFPPGPECFSDVPAHPETDRECDLIRDLTCLVDRVRAGGDDRDAELREFVLVFLEAD